MISALKSITIKELNTLNLEMTKDKIRVATIAALFYYPNNGV